MQTILQALFVVLLLGPPLIRGDRSPTDIFEGPVSFDVSYLLHIGAWLVAGLFALLRILNGPSYFRMHWIFRAPLIWYTTYSLIAVVSSVYSLSPAYTLFFSAKMIVGMLISIALSPAGAEAASLLLRLLYLAYGTGWLVVAFLFLLAPDLVGVESSTFGYRLTAGGYGSYALICGIAFLVSLLYSARSSKWLWVVGYLASWVFVLLSKTRSTITAGIIILLVASLLHPRWRTKLAAVYFIAFGMLVSLVVIGPESIVEFLMRGQDWDALSSLTGRSAAFSYLMDHWRRSPWLGFGFAAGNRYLMGVYMLMTGAQMASAHDALSKVLIDLGLVGALFLFLATVSGWGRMIWLVARTRNVSPRFPLVLQYSLIMLWITLHSIVSGGVADVSLEFIIVLIGVSVLGEEREVRGMIGQAAGTWLEGDRYAVKWRESKVGMGAAK